eukprot:1138652-Pelagomonas_calceolata.AAC.1
MELKGLSSMLLDACTLKLGQKDPAKAWKINRAASNPRNMVQENDSGTGKYRCLTFLIPKQLFILRHLLLQLSCPCRQLSDAVSNGAKSTGRTAKTERAQVDRRLTC